MTKMLVLNNALLIDGKGGDPQPGVSVVVADGIIKEVSHKEVRIDGARKIDLKGKCLMPGLIDAHVHPGALDLNLEDQINIPPAVFVHKTTRNLENDLKLGFTTLRDGCTLDRGFRTAIEQGYIKGPRLYLATSQIVQSGAESYRPGYKLRDPMPQNSLGMIPQVCDGPDEVRRGARRALGLGADQIKIFASGEVVSQSKEDRARPDQWKFTVPEIAAAVETAEAAGTYVMAHAYGANAIQNCIHAGVRSIEHGNLMDPETAALMAEKRVFYVPTLTCYQVLAKESRGYMTSYMIAKLETVLDKGLEALEMAYRAGVKICSGSDIVGPNQELKGRELALKAEVMTPMEAIVSATRTNAELINMADKLGTVEPDKIADIIVVDSNPMEDLSLFEKGFESVMMVLKDGQIMKNTLSR